MSGGGAIVGGRATGRAVVAAAVCMATLAVAGLAARAAEADTGVVSTERQTGLEQRSVGSGVLRHIGAALGTIAMLVVVGLGFVVIDVLVPAATALARVAVRATASAGASVCVGVAIGVWGLYYFRYYYAAPPKQAPGLDSAKGADRFDLHPDVAREDSDSAYMGLLESDDDAAKVLRGGLGGAGFPADFLKMFMKSISIFGYIEEAVFHEFSRQLQTRRLLAGEQMFDGEGDRDDLSFYVVIDGRVEIFLAGEPVAGGSEETGSGSEAGEWAASGQSESGAESDSEASGSPEAAAAAGGPQLASKSAILLNTVGPGDVLSSLFSILSLFTEDVPLHPGRCQPPGAAEDPGRHALDAYRFGRLDAQAAAGGSGESAADARPPRPNVVARATTDTTLAMIPAAAFQRVTRLYPTAAAHILQVILTRLQRVTFATLYDYLDLPDELVAIERAIGALARRPLRAEIAGSETLRQIRQLYAHHEPLAPSRASPPADAGHMPAAWRIDRASLDLLLGPASSRRSSLRHRRAGSDAEPASAAPSDAALAGLRRAVFHQLCDALGIDPYAADGRHTPAPTPPLTPAGPSAHGSRRGSVHRRAPRTEPLVPLLQTLGGEPRRAAATPLAQIPTLTDEVQLYHVPDGHVLVEQGQRPAGLFVVLHGRVAIAHRDAASAFTGVARDGDQLAAARDTARARRMARLAAAGIASAADDETPASDASPASGASPANGACAGGAYCARAGDVVGYLPAVTDMAALYTARSRGRVVVGFVSRWALERMGERFPIVLMTLARRLTSRLPAAVLNIDYALEWVQARAGQTLWRQGAASDAVYVVLSGRLRAVAEQAGAARVVGEYGQAQSVGEPGLLLGEPSRFSVHAIRDAELVRIPRALFRALMQTAPALAFRLAQTLAARAAGARAPRPGDQPRNLTSVALLPTDDHVPVGAFAAQLARALDATGCGRVAVVDGAAMSRALGRHAFSRMARLKLAAWAAELEQRSRLLLLVADGGARAAWTRHCVRHADLVLLVGCAAGDARVGAHERVLLALRTSARTELALLHDARACATGTARAWLDRRPWVRAHHHVHMRDAYAPARADGVLGRIRTSLERYYRPDASALPPRVLDRIRTGLAKYLPRRPVPGAPATSRGLRSDFARLARRLCGRSVGVVLGGGGARGLALLGVLQAFEEAGIPVDMAGGTSIGAFVGGLYARHPDSLAIRAPLRAFARRMSSTWRFLLDVTFPILAYTSGREFNRAVARPFGDAEIEDLWLPFYCMSANITQSRAEVHAAGLLWPVVRASMSLGGFVPPLCDARGDLLVDGGYLDNLPVHVMRRDLGAHVIFAVDIAGENDVSPVRYGASVSGFWVLLNRLNPLRAHSIPTLSEVQSRLAYASSDRELARAKVADGCVYLRVPPRDVGVLDFARFDDLYRHGYACAKRWTRAWLRAGLLDEWLAAGPPEPELLPPPHGELAAAPAGLKLTRRNSI